MASRSWPAGQPARRIAPAQRARDNAGNKTCAGCGKTPTPADRLVIISGIKVHVSHTTDQASGYFGRTYYEVPPVSGGKTLKAQAAARARAAAEAAAAASEAVNRFRGGYTIDSVARATGLSRPALRDIATAAGLNANTDGRTYTVPAPGAPVLTLVPEAPAGTGAWQDEAACAEVDPEIFHPAKGEPTRPAKTVCQICPVRAQCLEYAIATDQRHGVWGGMSEQERTRLRRATATRKQPAAA